MEKTGQSKKKLSLLSCIMVVVGSCVGAGIFFKNGDILKYSQHSLVLAIVCWLIAALGVLCMGLALIEIVSGCTKPSNLGMGMWCRVFNRPVIYKMCRNFIAYLYCPIILIALAYYFVQAFFSALGPLVNQWAPDWYVCAIIAFVILTWFFFTSGLSLKFFNVQNWIIMSLKFFPIIFAMIIGFVVLGMNHGHLQPGVNPVTPTLPALSKNVKELSYLSPVLGIVASIPAIFFTFNGFQYPANLVDDMKNPKHLPIGMIVGIIIVVLISLGISCSLIISTGDGTISGLQDWLKEKHAGWLYSVVYILIGLGILGVINGTIATAVKQVNELIMNKEILFSHSINKLTGRFANKDVLNGVLYYFLFTITIFIVATVIGCFYVPLDAIPNVNFSNQTLGLFNFVGEISNWDVLGIYIFIGLAIFGGLLNRKTNKVAVSKKKYFVVCAIISCCLVALATGYLFIQTFVDLGFAASAYRHHHINTNDLIPKILTLLVLFVFTGIICIPAFINKKPLTDDSQPSIIVESNSSVEPKISAVAV